MVNSRCWCFATPTHQLIIFVFLFNNEFQILKNILSVYVNRGITIIHIVYVIFKFLRTYTEKNLQLTQNVESVLSKLELS